jgi:preprotein translocase subunit SecD
MYPSADVLQANPAAAAAATAAAAAAGELSPQELEVMRALLDSGSLPVVLGDEGQPVVGPQGEPVIVGPGGQQMAVGPAGGMTPYKKQQKRSTGS